jgi:hypothetical protein
MSRTNLCDLTRSKSARASLPSCMRPLASRFDQPRHQTRVRHTAPQQCLQPCLRPAAPPNRASTWSPGASLVAAQRRHGMTVLTQQPRSRKTFVVVSWVHRAVDEPGFQESSRRRTPALLLIDRPTTSTCRTCSDTLHAWLFTSGDAAATGPRPSF